MSRELALPASNRSYRVLYAHAKASLLTELGVQSPFHTTTFLRDARTLALANGPRRRAINAVLVEQCRLLAINATNCSVARGVAAARAHAHTRKYAEDDKDHDGNRWCDVALVSVGAGDAPQPPDHTRQLFGRERVERHAHARGGSAGHRRHQQKDAESWLSWLVSGTADGDRDGDGDRNVCESFVLAQRALRRTLWFGMTGQWTASVCTYHSVTKRRFPKEDATVCPRRTVGRSGNRQNRGRDEGQGNTFHGAGGSAEHRVLYGRGDEPSADNNLSICPLLNAEAMLEHSPAKLAVEAIESSPELSDLLALLLEGEASLAFFACHVFPISSNSNHVHPRTRSPPLRHRTRTPLPTIPPTYGILHFSHFRRSSVVRGWAGEPGSPAWAERALVEYASALFKRRVERAAETERRGGFSEHNTGPHLTAACFLHPPPAGLAWRPK